MRVAILGAGIMGASTALYLARAGVDVSLFDKAAGPLSGASRWNEGKIHLGYIYSADPSLDTARRILPGGLLFEEYVRDLLGSTEPWPVTDHNDTYLAHARSVVSADSMEGYFSAVSELVREHPEARKYLVDACRARVRRLTRTELGRITDSEQIVAAFEVPERSVDTQWIADRFAGALASEPHIAGLYGRHVEDLACDVKEGREVWTVVCGGVSHGPFDAVVNALWHGGPAIDARAGASPDQDFHHRYRVSLFARTCEAIDVSSAVIATGPFGDLKAYPGNRFYLSWYPSGLIAESRTRAPPPEPVLDETAKARIRREVFQNLGSILPSAAGIERSLADLRVEGGFVFALGEGELDDPAATLHRRDRVGIFRRGGYVSVNTGKYSIAPWLAKRVANSLLSGIGRG